MAESEARTVILVGRTGNGKSATGNSIIGADVFDSFQSSAGVTSTCQLHRTVLDNDQILNVIDTPGLYDSSTKSIGNELAKCITMAKDGVHAVVVVLSLTTRFYQEEVLVIETLKQFFGDYMIVVFAHGDALRKMSLADFLGCNCSGPLTKIIEMCGNRYVLFDNATEDELKKSKQRKELLDLIDTVVDNNGGIPYSNELFVDFPDICENGVKFNKAYEELLLEKQMAESATTVVLVGKTGNGKSATGNSIIGADVFDSFPSSAGVTATCQLHKTVLENDHILNVIDTPGLFDTSVEPGIIRDEIAKCIQMAKNGIHAVVVVLSLRNRFSQEEVLVIETLKQFFGPKIGDYMILVFAHGDALGKMSLADYLGRNCPEELRRVLEMCGNRYLLFDNATENELKKSQQQKELLRLVDAVVVENGGIPYSNELFVDFRDESESGVKFNEAYEQRLLDKIESKLQGAILRMEKQLADEQAARKQEEAKAQEDREKATAEIRRLSEQLEISRKEAEELRKCQQESEKKFEESKEKFAAEQRRLQAEIQNKGNCAIL